MKPNNSLTKQAENQAFSTVINQPAYQKAIGNVIKDKKTYDRFVASVVSAVNNTPSLSSCTPLSIISGALLGESLKLSPAPQLGHFYLVPFGNKAAFVLGYKGFIQLATRSGCYRRINVLPIKQGELEFWNPLTEEFTAHIIEDDIERERAITIGYYASFEYLNGFTKTIYWSKQKMLTHADRYSPAFKSSVMQDIENGKIAQKDMWKYSSHWYKDFDSMACKTMLRQLIGKWGIMSTDMQTAYEADEGIVTEDGTVIPAEIPADDARTDSPKVTEKQVTDFPEQQEEPVQETFDDILFG